MSRYKIRKIHERFKSDKLEFVIHISVHVYISARHYASIENGHEPVHSSLRGFILLIIYLISYLSENFQADAITNHQHSILLAFKKSDEENWADKVQTAKDTAALSGQPHPVIVYVKADSTDEIRWFNS
jgi:hypothetical protein